MSLILLCDLMIDLLPFHTVTTFSVNKCIDLRQCSILDIHVT